MRSLPLGHGSRSLGSVMKSDSRFKVRFTQSLTDDAAAFQNKSLSCVPTNKIKADVPPPSAPRPLSARTHSEMSRNLRRTREHRRSTSGRGCYGVRTRSDR